MIRGYPVCYIQILLLVVFSFSRGHVNILTLSSWHFYFVPLLADGLYSAVSTQLVKRSQKMMEKYRQLLFDESMVSIFVYFKAYTATCIFFFSCFKPCEMVHIVQEWSWGFITQQLMNEAKHLMKNCGDWGGCWADNTLRDLHNSSYDTN